MGFELAIVKRIFTAYDGDIRVESEYGKGTTFYLTPPIE
jgi:signal transduction histidine kinase